MADGIDENGMLETGIRCAYSAFLRQQGAFEDVPAFYRRWHSFMDAGKPADPDFAGHEWPFDERQDKKKGEMERAISPGTGLAVSYSHITT